MNETSRTERKRSSAGRRADDRELERRVEERTRELSALLEVSRTVASTLELEPLLDVVLEQLKVVADYRAAAISVLAGDHIRELRRRTREGAVLPGRETPLPHIAGWWSVIARGQPVIVRDVQREEPLAQAFRTTARHTQTTAPAYEVRAWLVVPLTLNDRVIGAISLSHEQPGFYSTRHAQIATAIATQVAASVENAQLYAQTEQRTRELSTLLDVTRSISSTLALEPLLYQILEQLQQVMPYRGASIAVVRDGALETLLMRDTVDQERANEQLGFRVPLERCMPVWEAVQRGEPVLIGDVRNEDDPNAALWREANGTMSAPLSPVRAWLAAPLSVRGEVFGLLSLSRDVPDSFTTWEVQVAVAFAGHAAVALQNARLHDETEQRTRELAALLEVSRAVASTLSLEPLLALVLEQLKTVLDYRGATLTTIEGESLLVAASRAVTPERERDKGVRLPFDRTGPIWEALSRGESVLIADVRGDEPAAREYRAINGSLMDEPSHRDIRAWMAVPLVAADRVIGMLSASQDVPGYFTLQHAGLARAVADQAAVAIENARLYEEEHRTSLELATLLDVSRNVSATLELEPLLGQILDQVKLVVDYTSAVVITREGDRFVTREYRGPLPREVVLSRPLSAEMIDLATLDSGAPGETLIISDVWGDAENARSYRALMGEDYLRTVATYLRTLLSAPMVFQGRLVGVLSLTHHTPGFFTSRHATLVQAIADQATVAIENARLYGNAHKLAALEERQRLARELHDSVSQALFGIALGARTARRRLEQDPPRVGEALDYVLSLAEAGLTEMRALIFELRPEALENDGLVVALTRHAAAVRARHEIAVELDLCEEPDVPLATKEAIYRIAQEAMHNTVKHARANRIDMVLARGANGLTLDVRDDGAGFDPSQHFVGHLGLHSMRERILTIGGSVEIESAPGAGTRIRATVPEGRR